MTRQHAKDLGYTDAEIAQLRNALRRDLADAENALNGMNNCEGMSWRLPLLDDQINELTQQLMDLS